MIFKASKTFVWTGIFVISYLNKYYTTVNSQSAKVKPMFANNKENSFSVSKARGSRWQCTSTFVRVFFPGGGGALWHFDFLFYWNLADSFLFIRVASISQLIVMTSISFSYIIQ